MRCSARSFAAALAIIGLLTLGMSGTARAVPTVSVEFAGSNTITVTSSSAIVTASVFVDLTEDPAGANAYAVDFDFDSAGQNVLDFVGGTELLPTGYTFNLSPECCDIVTESALGVPGSVFSFALEAASFVNARGGDLFLIGTLQFHVTDEFGTTDVTPRLSTEIGLVNNNVPYPTVNLVGGTIHHPVPEPGSAALLALGLGALAGVGRSRRA